MMSLRTISVAFALAALSLSSAGCAPSSNEPFQSNVAYATANPSNGWGQPVSSGYGGWGTGYSSSYGYGGASYYGQSALFRPARGITCDRAREICYDRYGLSYYATQRYFSEHDANQSVRKYGEQVFLFSPKRGVNCDRRTRTCADAGGLDVGWTDDVFGDKSERKVNTWLGGDSFVPERYVTCVNATKVCSNQNGPSVNLTEVYYGREAAQDLADQLGAQVSPLTETLQGAPQGGTPTAETQPQPLAEPTAPIVQGPAVDQPLVDQPFVSVPDGPAPEFIPEQPEQPVVQLEPPAPEMTPQPELQPEPLPIEQVAPQPEPEPQPVEQAMPQAESMPMPQPEPAPVAEGGGAAPACADPAGCAQ